MLINLIITDDDDLIKENVKTLIVTRTSGVDHSIIYFYIYVLHIGYFSEKIHTNINSIIHLRTAIMYIVYLHSTFYNLHMYISLRHKIVVV